MITASWVIRGKALFNFELKIKLKKHKNYFFENLKKQL